MEQEYWPSRREVMEMLDQKWSPHPTTEEVILEAAIGRILAADMYAVHSIPVVRASSMDGIAVISSMFTDGIPDTSKWLVDQQFVRADTGDDFADQYDAVIAIEDVEIYEYQGIKIAADIEVKKGMNIRPRGSFFAKGDLLAKKWTKLTPSDLAALAAGGITKVAVIKAPVVAFVPTGSELLPIGTPVSRGKNIDSNTLLVKHMLLEMGAEPLCFPIVKDDVKELERVLHSAGKQADIVILNGGSSKGDEDFNARLLKFQGEVLCHNIAAAPGRPMCVAMVAGKPVINIPGPSIACYYGMDWCIRFLVGKWLRQPLPKRRTIKAQLAEEIRYHKGMEILCKMEIWKTEDGYAARQVPFRNSTMIENLSAPGQFITSPALDRYEVGTILDVELLREEGWVHHCGRDMWQEPSPADVLRTQS